MLNPEIIRKIEDFVYSKPRSVQEIAIHIGKNWRTADRYVMEIEKEYGTISTRVFREGTRGALKIVFWASVEKVSHGVFQEKLEQQIMKSRRKEEFSSFDIFQYADSKKKEINIESNEEENISTFEKLMLNAEKQLLVFSGNMSFLNLKNKKTDLFHVYEELVKKGISIKILSRVDLDGIDNIERALSLNKKYGKELVEIRHDEHPLRAVIIDNKMIRMKEVKEPTGKINELNKRVFIYYTIKEKDWVEWLTKIFWKKWSNSIRAEKRLEELHKIKVK